uniref:Uncharacterized protein n=1 Tax=Ananas comosus var. bracteatus TaxID=296719 RepID=A0A6V7QI51_ANACO|nr:unnamed protein product [Ananas comosus var. bracteatus]
MQPALHVYPQLYNAIKGCDNQTITSNDLVDLLSAQSGKIAPNRINRTLLIQGKVSIVISTDQRSPCSPPEASEQPRIAEKISTNPKQQPKRLKRSDIAKTAERGLPDRNKVTVPATRGCSDASGGEHGDRLSVLIAVLTSFRVSEPLVSEISMLFMLCAQFTEFRVARALPTVAGIAPKGEHGLRHAETYQAFMQFWLLRLLLATWWVPTRARCGLRDFRRVTVIVISMLISCLGVELTYLFTISVIWLGGSPILISMTYSVELLQFYLDIRSRLVADGLYGTHFTNTSGLIHRKRVFFSGKVVGLPTREPRGFIARVYASDPGASLRGSVLLTFIGLRYPLGGETCLHVLTSPTIFQLPMPTTRSKSAGADAAANFEEVETSATSGSSEVCELRNQLSVLTDLVPQQAAAAQQQADAARRHEARMKRLEDLLLQQTAARETQDPTPPAPAEDATTKAPSPALGTSRAAPSVEPREEVVAAAPVQVPRQGQFSL